MKHVIVIVGPTASGKTKIAIELAKGINGEIISADSMQLYKYMDIGTAKPTLKEMQGIKHYLIDEVNPDEEFNVVRFKELALKYIEKIIAVNKKPIVVGGTGLYINSLISNIDFSEAFSDWEYREKLKKEAEETGNEQLYNMLKEVDPMAAEKIHVNDTRRIIRALEVYHFTGKPISYHQEISRLNPPQYNYIVFGLNINRERLYERINDRIDNMLASGLVDEVRTLVEMGYNINNIVAMQGLGYKEILSYLRGECTLEEAVYILKRDTRHYAKRQLTWFRRDERIIWIDLDKYKCIDDVLKIFEEKLATTGFF